MRVGRHALVGVDDRALLPTPSAFTAWPQEQLTEIDAAQARRARRVVVRRVAPKKGPPPVTPGCGLLVGVYITD